MLDVSYEVPSLEGLRRCVINEDVVDGKTEPELYFEEERRLGA